MTAVEEFTSALSQLRHAAGEPPYKALVSYAKRQGISVALSSLSDWFTGKSIPAKSAALRCIVTCLADEARMPPVQRAEWCSRLERLRAAAWKERHPAPAVPAPAPGSSVHRIASGTTIGRHAGPVSCVVCTEQAGGLLSVSGGYDDAVRIWNVEEQRQVAALTGHKRAVNAVLVSRIGARAVIVSAADDWSVHVWDLEDQRRIGRLKTYGNGDIRALAAHPQVSELLVLERGWDSNGMRSYNRVRVWDLATQRAKRSLTYWRPGDACGLAIGVLGDGPDGVPVAIIGGQKGATVRLLKRWNNSQGRLEPRRDGWRKNPVTSVICSSYRARTIAVTSSRRGIHGWDLVSKRRLFGFRPGRTVYKIACVSLDERLIILGTGSGPVTGWDAESGRRVFELASSATTRAVTTGVLHDRPVVVTGDDDGLVRLWDVEQEIGH